MKDNKLMYIQYLKEQHHELNRKKDLTKEQKIKKLHLKDEITRLQLDFSEEYGQAEASFGTYH
jgi:hypothetical protein